MTIVQFPTKETQEAAMLQTLNEKIEKLSSIYDSLSEIHKVVHLLEMEAADLEERFNSAVREYVKETGNRVPSTMQEYYTGEYYTGEPL